MNRDRWLLIRGVDPSLWACRLTSTPQVVGRAPECQIQIAHPTVSRRHAEIWRDDRSIHVRDLRSRNGTYRDGVRITQTTIDVGMAIQFGSVAMDVAEGDLTELTDAMGVGQSTHVRAQESEPDGSLVLSRGQRQVLDLLLRGLPEKGVAAALCVSHHTVHSHVKQIYKLLGVRSRAELMARYVFDVGTAAKM